MPLVQATWDKDILLLPHSTQLLHLVHRLLKASDLPHAQMSFPTLSQGQQTRSRHRKRSSRHWRHIAVRIRKS